MASSTLIKEIISTQTARVAEYRITPQTRGREHIHNQVFEELFCLQGTLRVERDRQEDTLLNCGDRVLIDAGTKHCVNNDSNDDARFLVVQGGGEFDFVT